jgi:glutathione S-transferase
MPEMRLYYSPGALSLAAHIALIEAGLPFKAVRVDEHTKAMEGGGDYRQVHWLGYVPALLLDDGTLLTESAAILQHVAELASGPHLVPRHSDYEWLLVTG